METKKIDLVSKEDRESKDNILEAGPYPDISTYKEKLYMVGCVQKGITIVLPKHHRYIKGEP